jgi:hypothetical protein
MGATSESHVESILVSAIERAIVIRRIIELAPLVAAHQARILLALLGCLSILLPGVGEDTMCPLAQTSCAWWGMGVVDWSEITFHLHRSVMREAR